MIDFTQYLAFVPLLIYGMGLTTLMVDWKRIFEPGQIFLPYTLLSLVLSEIAIYNIFIYIRLIAEFKEQNYLSYLTFLIPPTVFYITTNVFTPDTGTETKTYFINRMRLFFTLFAIMIASHFLYNIEEAVYATGIRLFFISVLLLIAFLKKTWMSYVVVFLWLISFIVRGDIMVS